MLTLFFVDDLYVYLKSKKEILILLFYKHSKFKNYEKTKIIKRILKIQTEVQKEQTKLTTKIKETEVSNLIRTKKGKSNCLIYEGEQSPSY